MDGGLRNDGDVTLWQWQRLINGHWVVIELPCTGDGYSRPLHPVSWHQIASGKCWQEHGVKGFLSQEEAMACVGLVMDHVGTAAARLVRIHLIRETNPVVTIHESSAVHPDDKTTPASNAEQCFDAARLLEAQATTPLTSAAILAAAGVTVEELVHVFDVANNEIYGPTVAARALGIRAVLDRLCRTPERDQPSPIGKRCGTCHGNSRNTPGGGTCDECGLIGSQPWGG